MNESDSLRDLRHLISDSEMCLSDINRQVEEMIVSSEIANKADYVAIMQVACSELVEKIIGIKLSINGLERFYDKNKHDPTG